MAGSSSVHARAIFALPISRFLKRLFSFLAHLSFLAPALVFAQAQMSTPGAFAVSPSGAATYTIPIQVPPGTAGMQPSLALTYNSQAGNGLAGMGWSLSGFSAIHRCPATYVQDGFAGGINYDANDRFCLDGERLILVTGTYGAVSSEYRTEHESFSKVTMLAANDFEVRAKSGQVIHYRAMMAAPPKNTTAALWVLDQVKDRAGNYMNVVYGENNLIGEFWPSRIEYTGTANSSPYLSVHFEFEMRTDIDTGYTAGAIAKSTNRLRSIKSCMGVGPTPCANTPSLVKNYSLTYEAASSPSTNRSRLRSVTECDSSGICLPATILEWRNETLSYSPPHATYLSSNNYAGYYTELAGDFNGDGRTDISTVVSDSGGFAVYAALSRGDGTFAPMQQTIMSTSNFGGAEYKEMTGDFNGDGKTDLALLITDLGGFAAYVYLKVKVLAHAPDRAAIGINGLGL